MDRKRFKIGQSYERLAKRADLPYVPNLQEIETDDVNAMASSHLFSAPDVTISTGMIENMSLREILNVLAHELAHITLGHLWAKNGLEKEMEADAYAVHLTRDPKGLLAALRHSQKWIMAKYSSKGQRIALKQLDKRIAVLERRVVTAQPSQAAHLPM